MQTQEIKMTQQSLINKINYLMEEIHNEFQIIEVKKELNEINWKKAAMVGTAAAGLGWGMNAISDKNPSNHNLSSFMSKMDVTSKNAKQYIDLDDQNQTTTRPSFAGRYRKHVIEKIIKSAINNDVDPYLALGIGLAESRFGEEDANVMQVIDKNGAPTIENGVKILKKALTDYSDKDLVFQIQAYNGLGKLKGDYYGRGEDSIIDMSKEPLYGERVLDLVDNVIKQSPEIKTLIDMHSK